MYVSFLYVSVSLGLVIKAMDFLGILDVSSVWELLASLNNFDPPGAY